MTGSMSRRKGQSGEREIFKILGDALGIKIERNLVQTRSGGADAQESVGQFAVEVKRQETVNLPAWWKQTTEQANAAGRRPLLLYRRSRQAWRGVVLGDDLCELLGATRRLPSTVELSLDQCVYLIQLSMEK